MEFEDNKCVVCGLILDVNTVIVKERGLLKFIESSIIREDGKEDRFKYRTEIKLHKTCRNTYNNPKCIEAEKKRKKKESEKVSESYRKKKNEPKSLAVLCERVIKKYKLIAPSEPKKFTPPDSFSVVGGKALRKRSEGPFPRKSRNTYSPRSLAVLCQLVIEGKALPEKKSRGRPRKAVKKDEPKIKRSKGRPHKDSNLWKIQQPAVLEEEPISYPVKEESSTPYLDPLQDEEDEEDYTVEIKLEDHDSEIDEFTHVDPVVTSPQSIAIIPQSTVTYPQSHMQVPGPSTILPRTPQFITVVMDEYQIFANRIAEQLRGFPPQRALLLQRGIQAMIDNERELIEDEN